MNSRLVMPCKTQIVEVVSGELGSELCVGSSDFLYNSWAGLAGGPTCKLLRHWPKLTDTNIARTPLPCKVHTRSCHFIVFYIQQSLAT